MNSRFATAVHILTLLEQAGGKPVKSERMAQSINTNPSLVRRLLVTLAQAGITTSQMGAGGGALLAREASTITLLDVHRAMADESVFAMPGAPSPHCMVGRNIQQSLLETIDAATRPMFDELARTSITDMLARVRLQESTRTAGKQVPR